MKGLRAVVVDDNNLNRELVARALEARGMEIAQAADALSGFKTITAHDPQLAVIDVMMPGAMDGIGLCQLIRSCPRFSALVIVMITASDKRREADRALSAGADILISKPFSPKEFMRQVEDLLKTRRRLPPSSYRIFILDDDEASCRLAEQTLARAGYEVLTETNPSGAIATVRNFQPDLILLDVMMPQIDGPDFAAVIAKERSLKRKPKVLLYSNKSENELKALADRLGVHGYLCKVDGPAALIRATHRTLMGGEAAANAPETGGQT